MSYISKSESSSKLLDLLDGESTEFVISCLTNWFNGSELAEFVEFVEQELE